MRPTNFTHISLAEAGIVNSVVQADLVTVLKVSQNKPKDREKEKEKEEEEKEKEAAEEAKPVADEKPGKTEKTKPGKALTAKQKAEAAKKETSPATSTPSQAGRPPHDFQSQLASSSLNNVLVSAGSEQIHPEAQYSLNDWLEC